MRFEILKSRNGQFYWHIKSANGQVLAASETYTAKQSAVHAIDVVRSRRVTYQVWQSPRDRRYFWHIKAGNGEILASSQGYSSHAAASQTADNVRRGAPSARVLDLTISRAA
jgi:uncharacterized protein YegP (UPF0339 family)